MYTHIFLVFAWKETWEISQHSLCVGEKLTFHCALFCTFWIFSRHFFFFVFNWMGPGFLLEEFGRSGEKQKPDHTGTSLKKARNNCFPSQLLTLAARSTMTTVRTQKAGRLRERARQQMFLSSHGTRWPTKPSSNPSFALLVWPWTHYLTSLGLLSSTVKCGENVPNSCGEG